MFGLTGPHCQLRGVGQGMNETYNYFCGMLYFKLCGIDTINEITKLIIIQCKGIIYIAELEIKGSHFFSFFLEKTMHEVCLVRIKEQFGEKQSTVVSIYFTYQ